MKLKGAIFDLDGTLFDSMGMWQNLASVYVKSLGVIPEKDLDKKLTSMTLGQAIEYCIDNYNLPGTVPEHIRSVTKRISSFYKNDVQLKPSVIQLLDYLKEANVKMCIATATDIRLVEPAVKRNAIYDYFSNIFTCAGVGSNKRQPKIYDVSLEHLGTAKENTVVFEDALYAAITAKKAGYKVVGVYDENESEQEQLKALCDIYVKSLGEITPGLLESIL